MAQLCEWKKKERVEVVLNIFIFFLRNKDGNLVSNLLTLTMFGAVILKPCVGRMHNHTIVRLFVAQFYWTSSLYFPSGQQTLMNQNPILNSISCRVKWKTDLCRLVEHHLCWQSEDDLRWAGIIQQTSMKYNMPLMDICCGSVASKCQRI